VQFTPSAGSNFQNVDDTIPGAHDGDTTYNQSGTNGHVDWMSYSSAFSGMAASAIAAAVHIYAAKAPDGGTHSMRGKVKSGGTTANGTTAPLNSSYTRRQDAFAVDPNTGNPWASLSAITSAEFGYERVN
jgi:hypothetical protein